MDQYLFPTGAIREIEKKLFDYNDMERMIDASDASKSFQIFNELSYADELLDVDSPERYREVLAHDLAQVRDFIISISPDRRLNDLIFAFYDFHNLKLIYKARSAGNEDTGYFSDLGMADPKKMEEYIIRKNKAVSLPDHIKVVIENAEQNYKELDSARKIDRYFDKVYFGFIYHRARELKGKRLISLIDLMIETANIKMIIRGKTLGMSLEETKEYLIMPDIFDSGDYLKVYDEDMEELTRLIGIKFSNPELQREISKFKENYEFWKLEKVFDNYIFTIINETKMYSHGPFVLFAYFWGHRNAVKNIQIIMAGKLNDVAPEEIKERVRKLY